IIDWTTSTIAFSTPPLPSLLVNTTSMSTKLAIKLGPKSFIENVKKFVPSEYHEYLKIFSEEVSSCLPESKPWDHTIDLKPGFVPRSSKVYPLTPEEEKLIKEMIDEHLAQGTIQHSKSPQASGWFFVSKKDRKKCP